VSEQSERLRAAVERLMEAQREALDATNRALDAEVSSGPAAPPGVDEA